VLQGIVAGYAEWRNQQVELSAGGFTSLKRVQGMASGVRSPGDARAALLAAADLRTRLTGALGEEEGKPFWERNSVAVANYRQQLAQLSDLVRLLQTDWTAAQISRNKAADAESRHAANLAKATEFLTGDDAKALREEIAQAIDARRSPQEQLANARAFLSVNERALDVYRAEEAAGRNDAINQENILRATARREAALQRIAEAQKKITEEDQRQLAAKLAAIDNDFTLTEADKFGARQAAQGNRLGLGADPNSFIEQAIVGINRLRDAWGTTAQQIGQTIGGTIGGAVDLVTQGTLRWLINARDWKQGLLQGAQALGVNVLQSIIGVGVRWVATQIMMASVGKTLQAAAVASSIPLATAASAIWATPATLATIATSGAAALQAPPFIAMASTMTKAQSLIPGFEAGDFTGGRRGQIAGFVHGEEFVFSAPAVDAIGVGPLRSMHEAALGGVAGRGRRRRRDAEHHVYPGAERGGGHADCAQQPRAGRPGQNHGGGISRPPPFPVRELNNALDGPHRDRRRRLPAAAARHQLGPAAARHAQLRDADRGRPHQHRGARLGAFRAAVRGRVSLLAVARGRGRGDRAPPRPGQPRLHRDPALAGHQPRGRVHGEAQAGLAALAQPQPRHRSLRDRR
jgi:hypothetical protein